MVSYLYMWILSKCNNILIKLNDRKLKKVREQELKEREARQVTTEILIEDFIILSREYAGNKEKMYCFLACKTCKNHFLVLSRPIPREMWHPKWCPFCGCKFTKLLNIKSDSVKELDV